MSWYDYIPGRSFAKIPGDIYHGNFGAAGKDAFIGSSGFGDPLMQGAKDANNYFFKGPANEIKAAYDQASGQADVDSKKLTDFYMGQQGKAQAFYKPLQDMFNGAYGTGGIQAPQLPKKPLGSMYGGG